MYTLQYYLLKCFVDVEQLVSYWCCGFIVSFINIINYILCHGYVPHFSSGVLTLLFLIVQILMLVSGFFCFLIMQCYFPLPLFLRQIKSCILGIQLKTNSRNLKNQNFLSVDHHRVTFLWPCFLKRTLMRFQVPNTFILQLCHITCCI